MPDMFQALLAISLQSPASNPQLRNGARAGTLYCSTSSINEVNDSHWFLY